MDLNPSSCQLLSIECWTMCIEQQILRVFMSSSVHTFSAGCLCQKFGWLWILLDFSVYQLQIPFVLLCTQCGDCAAIFSPYFCPILRSLYTCTMERVFLFFTLKSHSHYFCNILWVHRSPLFSVSGEFTGTGIPGGKNNWESFWRLPTIRKILMEGKFFWGGGQGVIFDHLYFHFNTS